MDGDKGDGDRDEKVEPLNGRQTRSDNVSRSMSVIDGSTETNDPLTMSQERWYFRRTTWPAQEILPDVVRHQRDEGDDDRRGERNVQDTTGSKPRVAVTLSAVGGCLW